MKKIKNIALTLAATVLSVTAINANPVTVHPVNTDSTYLAEEPFSVKYLGNDGDYLLFEVTMNSDNIKNTSFEISDKSEGRIYSSYIRSAYKVQTMKIEKRDNQELDFKLVVGKNEYSKSFAILSTVRMETK